MNNKQIYETAKNQSAIDLNCHKDDFDKDYNVIVYSESSSAARNAIKSGFRPAWVEMTVKSNEFINEMNR